MALKSDAAAETSKNQLSRDFGADRFSTFATVSANTGPAARKRHCSRRRNNSSPSLVPHRTGSDKCLASHGGSCMAAAISFSQKANQVSIQSPSTKFLFKRETKAQSFK